MSNSALQAPASDKVHSVSRQPGTVRDEQGLSESNAPSLHKDLLTRWPRASSGVATRLLYDLLCCRASRSKDICNGKYSLESIGQSGRKPETPSSYIHVHEAG